MNTCFKYSNIGGLGTLALLFLSSMSFADGGMSGGGGDLVVINGEKKLADPFLIRKGEEGTFHCGPGERGELNPEVIAEIKRVDQLLTRYGAGISYGSPSIRMKEDPTDPWKMPVNTLDLFEESRFVQDYVLNSSVEYCFVDKLPTEASAMPLDLSVGEESHRYAYTTGNVTYFLKKDVQDLNIREFVKGIVHERLHAYAGGVKHGPIVDITNGIDLLLRLFDQQMVGERPSLAADQVQTITSLIQQIRNLWLHRGTNMDAERTNNLWDQFRKNYVVLQNGGGMAHLQSGLDPSAYVGVGSVIGPQTYLADHVEVLNSVVCKEHVVNFFNPGKKIKGYVIATGVHITNSWIGNCGELGSIQSNAKIEHSNIFFQAGINQGFEIDSDVKIRDTNLQELQWLILREGAVISNVNLRLGRITLESQARMLNMKDSTLYVNDYDGGRWPWGKEQPGEFVVSKGAWLNFYGDTICPKGTDILLHFFLHFEGRREFDTVKNLRKSCRK